MLASFYDMVRETFEHEYVIVAETALEHEPEFKDECQEEILKDVNFLEKEIGVKEVQSIITRKVFRTLVSYRIRRKLVSYLTEQNRKNGSYVLQNQQNTCKNIRESNLNDVYISDAAKIDVPIALVGKRIHIHANAEIGANCVIYDGVTIGENNASLLAIIDEGAKLLKSSKICGGCRVGKKSIVAPNTTVNFDIPDSSVVNVYRIISSHPEIPIPKVVTSGIISSKDAIFGIFGKGVKDTEMTLKCFIGDEKEIVSLGFDNIKRADNYIEFKLVDFSKYEDAWSPGEKLIADLVLKYPDGSYAMIDLSYDLEELFGSLKRRN